MMKHIVIITGGQLNLTFAKEYLKTLSYDEVFAVDRGLEYARALEIVPSCILGDFDTVNPIVLEEYENGELSSVIERHPVKKDATDTELAVSKALEEGADSISILGATGNRIDHMLANLSLLLTVSREGADCYIVDENNKIYLLDGVRKKQCTIQREKQHGDYISLIPVSPVVKGITLNGFLYPLADKTVCQGGSLTVSNQIVSDVADISFEEGCLLVVESRD